MMITFAFFGLLFFEACIRFTPAALEQPAAVLERAILCNRVDVQNGWAEPSAEQKIFVKGKDNHVFSFLEIRDLRDKHSLHWKWYDSSRRLSRAAEKITIGEKGKFFKKYIAWDQVSISEEKEIGVWTVAIFLDDRLVASRVFEIR